MKAKANRAMLGDVQSKTRTYRPVSAGDPVLLGFHAYGHEHDYYLEKTQKVIGRVDSGEELDIALPCAYVSALHGVAGAVGDKVFYRDLGSTNGTLYNSAPCAGTVALFEGDVLSFAPKQAPEYPGYKLVFAYDDGSGFSWQRIDFGPEVQEVVIGRAEGSVQVSDPAMTRRHASFFKSSRGPAVIDLESKNGVYVNGCRIEGSCALSPMDIVRVGSAWIAVYDDCLWLGVLNSVVMAERNEESCEAQGVSPVSISESVECIVPESTERIVPESAIADVSNREGRNSVSAVAEAGSSGNQLVIDIVERNVWSRVAKKTLLKDIHITVDPGDMVLILGGSGAGKTTFVKAVMGYDKAEGAIRYGDLDIYEEYDRLRYQIGYVPQQDLLRMNDTVEMTLLAAAQMRMAGKPSLEQCSKQAEWASDILGLSRESQTLVGDLSGGQRKRLSIAVELVGDPDLFFLDEPDSGLDGVMARSLMENLSEIASLNKMVLVITHGPDRAVDLFTKVLVLAKSERDGSGHLAFYGSVDEAKAFFDTDSLEGIVHRINRVDEGGEGLADYYIDLYSARFGNGLSNAK